MNGSVKIIGTNDITKDLQGKVFEDSSLISHGKLHALSLSKDKYLLDIKTTHVVEDCFLIYGIISNDASWAGNIALEFYPKSLDKDQKSA